MSKEAAFRIFPIVHKYGMDLMVACCEKAFEREQLDLWPSQPILSSEVANHPGLVQCLALADARQCDTMVQSCLSKLIKQPGADDTIRDALSSPHLYKLMDGLRSETKTNIMCRMAGLKPPNVSISVGTVVYYLNILIRVLIFRCSSRTLAGFSLLDHGRHLQVFTHTSPFRIA